MVVAAASWLTSWCCQCQTFASLVALRPSEVLLFCAKHLFVAVRVANRGSRGELQVMNAGHSLAGAPVAHDAGESLGPVVKCSELLAGLVVEDESAVFHWSITFLDPSSAMLAPCTDLPSERSKVDFG